MGRCEIDNQALCFLRENWGENNGFAAIWGQTVSQTFYRWPEQADELVRALAHHNADREVYVGWCLFDRCSRTVEAAKVVPGLLMDLDLGSGRHKGKGYPDTQEEALALLEAAGFPKPSRILHSGGGLYAQYLLTEPYVIGTDLDRQRIAQLTRGLTRRAIEHFQRHGRTLDNVADLARYTRVPGSVNWKYDSCVKVETVQKLGPRYTLEALEGLLCFDAMPANAARRRFDPGQIADRQPDARADFGLVRQHCRFVGKLAASPMQVTEPEWKAVATIAAHCENGAEHFHDLSSLDHERYDPGEADQKLAQSLGAGPRTCEDIATSLCFEGCQRCPFWGAEIRSPIGLAYGEPEVLDLQSRYILSAETSIYYPAGGDGEQLSETGFNNLYASRLKGKPHTIFIKSKRSPKAPRTDYVPGCSSLFIQRGGENILNLWRDGGVDPVEGDCQLLLRHFEYLFSEAEEREWVLDYLAHLVQKPDVKIAHAILLMGGQGTGKSFISEVLKELFGRENVFVDDAQIHAGAYRRPLGNRQVLVVEEMAIADLWGASNDLKPWLTSDEVTTHDKYVKAHAVRTPRGVFIFSNHAVPAKLEADDRRYLVSEVKWPARDPAYYNVLFEQGLKQVPAFKHFLMFRNIANWSPNRRPPMTEAKQDVQAGSRTPLASSLRDLIERGRFPRDLVTAEEVQLSLTEPYRQPTMAETTRALQELRACKVGKTRLMDGRNIRLWAIRNQEMWQASTPDARRAHLDGRVLPNGAVLSLLSSPPADEAAA